MNTVTMSLHEVEETGSYADNIIQLNSQVALASPYFPDLKTVENIPAIRFDEIVEGDFCPLNEW